MSYLTLAEIAVPTLTKRITDLTNTLTTEQNKHIEKKLATLEQTKGSQLAVLIVPTVKPESIESFSLRVVEKWKLGRENIDDGVLLTIAKNDRKVRIEVGNGLEGTITDIDAGRIIKEFITPEFRKDHFHKGILAGVEQIENLIKGEPLPAPSANQGNKIENPTVILAFIASFITPYITSFLGRILAVLSITAIGTTIIWFTTSQSTGSLLFDAFFLMFIALAFSTSRSNSYRNGGGHGGGFGGGSSSSGGFSGGGGGGGFSGGGASGSW